VGVPLGLFSHVVHEPKMTVMREGAALVVASRGVVEARLGSKEFGLGSVREIVASGGCASGLEMAERVVRAAERFMASPSFWGPRLAIPGFSDTEPNDMTAIALVRPAAGATLSAYAA